MVALMMASVAFAVRYLSDDNVETTRNNDDYNSNGPISDDRSENQDRMCSLISSLIILSSPTETFRIILFHNGL